MTFLPVDAIIGNQAFHSEWLLSDTGAKSMAIYTLNNLLKCVVTRITINNFYGFYTADN